MLETVDGAPVEPAFLDACGQWSERVCELLFTIGSEWRLGSSFLADIPSILANEEWRLELAGRFREEVTRRCAEQSIIDLVSSGDQAVEVLARIPGLDTSNEPIDQLVRLVWSPELAQSALNSLSICVASSREMVLFLLGESEPIIVPCFVELYQQYTEFFLGEAGFSYGCDQDLLNWVYEAVDDEAKPTLAANVVANSPHLFEYALQAHFLPNLFDKGVIRGPYAGVHIKNDW